MLLDEQPLPLADADEWARAGEGVDVMDAVETADEVCECACPVAVVE